MRVSATRWLRSGAGASPTPEHRNPAPIPAAGISRRPRVRTAAHAAVAAAAVPAVLFLLPSAGSVAAAERAPQPELGLDVCVDLGVVTVDLGCPPAPTAPPATSPPATTPPATTPPATAPPATMPPSTTPPATTPPATTPPATTPPATSPPATTPPALPLLPALPAVPSDDGPAPVPLIEDLVIETPVLACTLNVALIAATADCNLSVLVGLLPSAPALPPILGLDLNTLLDVPLGLANVQGVIDTDGGIGGTEGLTGDLCLDAAVLAPTAGACPEAQGIGDPMSLAVVDNCTNVAVLADLPADCTVPDDDGGVVDADACVGVNLADRLTPEGCAQADALTDGEIADVCADVDLVADGAGSCVAATPAPSPTTTPARSGTTTPADPGGVTPGTTGGSDPTTPGGGAGSAVPSGGPGARPSRVSPASGSLPMTGIAVAGTLLVAVALVVTGAGARLLARIPSRR